MTGFIAVSAALLLMMVAAVFLQVLGGQPLAAAVQRWRIRGLPMGPQRSVVMIAYYYPPHTEIGAARPHRFARYLRREGFEVAVVCSSEMLRRATDLEALAESVEHGAGEPPYRVPLATQTGWLHRSSRILGAFQRRFLPYNDRIGWFPCATVAAAHTLTRRSVLVSTHPPIVTHLVAAVLKLRYGLPWVADFRDPLWGNPMRTARRAAWIDPLVERLVVALADAVIANTDALAVLLRHRYPARAARIRTIPNGYDPEDVIEPRPRRQRGRRRVAHVGTLYGARTPLPFARSLERLIRSGALDPATVQFRQVGGCASDGFDPADPALRFLEAHGCYIRSARHMPLSIARDEMLDADMLLLLDINTSNPGLQIPAKLFEYVRAGRPILALTVPGSATEQMLARAEAVHRCIDLTSPPDMFDAAVLDFIKTEHPCSAPSSGFLHDHSAPVQVRTLVSILQAARGEPAHVTNGLGAFDAPTSDDISVQRGSEGLR